jgi:hypothetical protein
MTISSYEGNKIEGQVPTINKMIVEKILRAEYLNTGKRSREILGGA